MMWGPNRLTAQRMGAAIGAALEADGISQAEFSRRVGTSTKHLNQVISGTAVARAAELDYWAWALGREWTVTLSSPQESTSGQEP